MGYYIKTKGQKFLIAKKPFLSNAIKQRRIDIYPMDVTYTRYGFEYKNYDYTWRRGNPPKVNTIELDPMMVVDKVLYKLRDMLMIALPTNGLYGERVTRYCTHTYYAIGNVDVTIEFFTHCSTSWEVACNEGEEDPYWNKPDNTKLLLKDKLIKHFDEWADTIKNRISTDSNTL